MVLITLLAILSAGAAACAPGYFSWPSSSLCRTYCPVLSSPNAVTGRCEWSSSSQLLLSLPQSRSPGVVTVSGSPGDFPQTFEHLALAPSHSVEAWVRVDSADAGCVLRKGALHLCVDGAVSVSLGPGNTATGGKLRVGEFAKVEYQLREEAGNTVAAVLVDGEVVAQELLQDVVFEDDISIPLVVGADFAGTVIEVSVLQSTETSRRLLSCPSTCTRCTREGVCVQSCPANKYWDPSGACLSCLSVCTSGCLRGTDCVLRADMLSSATRGQCIDYAESVGGKCQCTAHALLTFPAGVPTCTCDSTSKYTADTTSKTCSIQGYYLSQGSVSGVFSADYKTAVYTFTSATNAGTNACSGIFVADTFAKLGDTPVCAWSTDAKKLTVTFGPGATLIDSDQATFNATNVQASSTSGTLNRNYLNIYATTAFPTPGPTPKAVIIAPEEYSVICGDLVLSGERSYNNYGRDLKYAWTLAGDTEMTLTGTFSAAATSQAVVKVPQSWLRPGTLTVTLTVTTFFGTSDSAKATINVSGGNVLPLVIEGGDTLTSYKTREVRVKASARSECVSGRNLGYYWLFASALPYTPPLDYNAILEAQANSQYLVIPPKALLANFTYYFTAFVYDVNDASVTGSKRFTLNMPWDALVVVVDKAAGGLFNQLTGLQLSAAGSYDPDEASPPLKFAWKCTVLETGKTCMSEVQNTDPLVPATLTSSDLTIDASKMKGNGNYTFTVTVSKQFYADTNYLPTTNLRVAERSMLMRAQNTSGPKLTMVQYPTRPIGGHSLALLEAKVDSTEASFFVWSQAAGPSLTSLMPSNKYYFLARDWVPGNTYTLTVSANLNNTAVVTLNVNVEVSKAPEGGSLYLAPTTVRELVDPVSVQLRNWVDAESNYPLTYEYRYVSGGQARLLKPQSPASYIEARLPDSTSSVQVAICDSLGSCTTVSKAINVVALDDVTKSAIDVKATFLYETLDVEAVPGVINRFSDSMTLDEDTVALFTSALANYYLSRYNQTELEVDTVLNTATILMASSPATTVSARQHLFALLTTVANRAQVRLTDAQVGTIHTLASAAITTSTVEDGTSIYREVDSLLSSIARGRSRFQLPSENFLYALTSPLQAYYNRQLASTLLGTTVSLNTAAVTFPADLFKGIDLLSDANAVVDVVVASYPAYSQQGRIYSDIVSFKIEYAGLADGISMEGLNQWQEVTLKDLATPVQLRVPRVTADYDNTDPRFLTKYDCVYLTSQSRWSPFGCSLRAVTSQYIDVASIHSSIFAIQDKDVTETILSPQIMDENPGVVVPCDHCGTILTPIWFNIVIFGLAVVLAVYGAVKDRYDSKRDGEYDFSVLRSQEDQARLDEQLRNRPVRPWLETFWEGHLFFGGFWYYRADLSRWARFLIIGVSLIAEECILGVLYWKVKDQPDDMCDRAIYEIYNKMGPTDAFLIFVAVITWTPFTILLVLLFHHLKTFGSATLYKVRVILACVLLFVFFGLGTAGVVELSIEMCASTSVTWTFSFIYLMIGEVAVTHSAIALARAFLVKCSQTAWREPVN